MALHPRKTCETGPEGPWPLPTPVLSPGSPTSLGLLDGIHALEVGPLHDSVCVHTGERARAAPPVLSSPQQSPDLSVPSPGTPLEAPFCQWRESPSSVCWDTLLPQHGLQTLCDPRAWYAAGAWDSCRSVRPLVPALGGLHTLPDGIFSLGCPGGGRGQEIGVRGKARC